ncbi:uncharacterized protein METZ01_LOCUS368293, partial [marine metagenome]
VDIVKNIIPFNHLKRLIILSGLFSFIQFIAGRQSDHVDTTPPAVAKEA